MNDKMPIGQLDVPEHVTLENIQHWLQDIASYTTRLRQTVDELTVAELEETYRQGSWTVRQLVHHIADSQLNMYQRLKLALTSDNPIVPAFEQDDWAKLADSELPVEGSIRILEGLNEHIVRLGNSLTEEQLDRKFTHQENGEIKVSTKIAKLAWHEEHHLAHIKMALGRWENKV